VQKLHLHQLIHEQLVYVKKGCWGCRVQQVLALQMLQELMITFELSSGGI
jgi:hypothetical protein